MRARLLTLFCVFLVECALQASPLKSTPQQVLALQSYQQGEFQQAETCATKNVNSSKRLVVQMLGYKLSQTQAMLDVWSNRTPTTLPLILVRPSHSPSLLCPVQLLENPDGISEQNCRTPDVRGPDHSIKAQLGNRPKSTEGVHDNYM